MGRTALGPGSVSSLGRTLSAEPQAHLQGFVELGRINKWAIPKQFKFVAEIPKTSVGKINKKLIREQELA